MPQARRDAASSSLRWIPYDGRAVTLGLPHDFEGNQDWIKTVGHLTVIACHHATIAQWHCDATCIRVAAYGVAVSDKKYDVKFKTSHDIAMPLWRARKIWARRMVSIKTVRPPHGYGILLGYRGCEHDAIYIWPWHSYACHAWVSLEWPKDKMGIY